MQSFDYEAPQGISEVIQLLAGKNGGARILAGGTDLLVQLREGRRNARLVIDVKNIPELTQITFDPKNGLRIGAATSCSQICSDPNVSEHFPGLVDAIHLIGGVQIQNRASVGGNLCNASPAADAIPALIVHEAVCHITGLNGTRTLPVEEFCVAPGKNALESGEFLTSISIPTTKERFGAGYLRFIPRNEMDIAVVGAGASVVLDSDRKRFVSARIALGAVAPTPLLASDAGAFLAGKAVTRENVKEAARMAQAVAKPITDLRGTAEHRKHLCAVLVERALDKAIERAGGHYAE
ncbi:MAG: carbon monoxide dehydrogenase [Anaerolineales bacterium]|nr:xanthine dehydrogenase family protein subunit M [Anaerolineae bacterium]PWB75140.1 MAG: carbon monoxide dehydrogenase [Anaerolineales bacterium]